MPEAGLKPVSALAGIVPGRHGTRHGPPGLLVQERDGLQIVSIAVRKGQDDALAAAVQSGWGVQLPTAPRVVDGGGVSFCWSGAGQWLAIAAAPAAVPAARAVPLERALRDACGTAASFTAQGDGRVVLRLSGPAVRDVLAAITPIDLHPRVFHAGDTAMTLVNHLGVQLRQLDDSPSFELLAFRGYGASLFETVVEAGLAAGVELLPTG